jgi:putative drug exporter of the RND superfamily
MDTPEVAATGGIFQRLGNVVVRWPLLVIACWIAVAATLSLALPPLTVVAAEKPVSPVPDDAPVMVTTRQMAQAFHETGTGSLLMIILTDDKGLGPADEDTYRTLVDKLRQDTQDKMSIQEFISTPPLREVLESKDQKAFNLPITFPGDVATPETQVAFQHVAAIVKKTVTGTALSAALSGPVATVADITALGAHDAQHIEIVTALSILVILVVIYRNLITMLVPLITIGVSVLTAQGTLSGLAVLGLDVNSQVIVFMSAVMIGAGTDYAVFLISRYHDYVRHGEDSDQAVKKALASIGKVSAASAATVAVTFLAMPFCKLPAFSAVGPAISISIIVAFLAAVTLLPAILSLTGRRGWIKPRRDLTARFWRRSGVRIVRRPRIHLVGSLIVLAILASSASLVRFNYDDLKTLPDSVDSARGYAAMDRHFPQNVMTPEVLFIQSPRDLRTPSALADLEQMAQRVSQLPNIVMVRGLTRPTGQSLEQTKLSFQAGEVGGRLGEASTAIKDHGGDLDHLSGGADQLAKALADVRGQVTQAVAGVSTLVNALSYMQGVMGADKALKDLSNSANLAARMRALGDALSANLMDAQNTIGWAGPILTALNASPVCDADPNCRTSRAELQELVAARGNGTLRKIDDLARNLQSTQEFQTLGATVNGLRTALNTAVSALQAAGSGIQARINQLQQGASALAEGSRAVADGVQALVNQTKKLGAGLNEASAFLLTMKHDAGKPSMAGFNLPAQAMASEDFKKGAQIFLSPDGHAARYLVQSALNSFTTEAMDQVNAITAAAQSAQPNTELADATISVAGIPSGLRDTRDYYNNDIRFIVIATIVIVFLILVALLRAIVAPLYLIGSVLISYLSALGIGVIVFQLILGERLHWSLPALTFILLVAVGADYNMLLISRIRDESPHGVRVGVIRTVGSTGGVITSAGLIFAASMFGLLSASITSLVQAGFIIGVGIVLDTFLVRTVTVPALAALIGQANWWPTRLGSRKGRRRNRRNPVRIPKAFTRLARIKGIYRSKNHTLVHPTISAASLDSGQASDDLLADHALPLFGPNGLPDQLINGARETTVDSPTTTNANGKHPMEDLPAHPLPLFSLNGLRLHLTNCLRITTVDCPMTSNGNGNQPIDHIVGHTLPPSGPLPKTTADSPTTTNGNGHTNANGNCKQPIDKLAGHALPLFGPMRKMAVDSSTPTNGNGHANGDDNDNGNGKRLVDHPNKTTDESGAGTS